MVLLAIVAWIVPERRWPAISRALAGTLMRLKRRTEARMRRRWVMLEDRVAPAALDRMPAANLAHRYVARMQGFREYRPGGWNPEIHVTGVTHIESALARGHGAVLWVAELVYGDFVTKKGLYEAGYRLSHLSRPSHNISPTRFGIRTLNPIWTRIEDRYLAERVTIRDNDSRAAIEILRARLSENRVVSITVGQQAARTAEVDFLDAKLLLATGPLHLARSTGAPLLPVFTVMEGTGRLVVHVERPLIAGDGDQGKSYEAIAQDYAQRLAPYLLRYPDQWGRA